MVRSGKAWTAADANPYSVQAELCAFADWDIATWDQHPQMLANVGAWIAQEAAAFGIPLRILTSTEAQSGQAGICEHVDLGAAGGGHWDCGPAFPLDRVVAMAGGQSPAPAPTDWSDDNMILVDPVSGGTWCVATKEGAVNAYGRAPYLGATNNNPMNEAHYPCAGIGLRPDDDGYRIVLDWGDAGNGKSADGGDRFRTYDFPRDGSGAVHTGTY